MFGSSNETDAALGGRTVGVWTDLLALSWEVGMKWRVMVELGGAGGALELREVSVGECAAAACSAETLGLTMAEGKKTLAGLQPQASPHSPRDIKEASSPREIPERIVEPA